MEVRAHCRDKKVGWPLFQPPEERRYHKPRAAGGRRRGCFCKATPSRLQVVCSVLTSETPEAHQSGTSKQQGHRQMPRAPRAGEGKELSACCACRRTGREANILLDFRAGGILLCLELLFIGKFFRKRQSTAVTIINAKQLSHTAPIITLVLRKMGDLMKNRKSIVV